MGRRVATPLPTAFGDPVPPEVSVAVIGAGTMGAGIARVAAAAGHPVLLFDNQPGAVEAALADLEARLVRDIEKGRLTRDEAGELTDRIRPVASLAGISDAGLVVEAIVEDLPTKIALFRELESIVGADALLATNTSSLSVTALASRLEQPERVVGMHFFNPAPLMPLVEIVSGTATAPEIAEHAAATARHWGKTPVHCASTPGFIVNRVARPFYGEALRLLAEGVADPATIDAIVTGAGGFRMGPFALMDLVGLDVNLAVSKSVYEQTFHDARFAPNVIQQQLVDAGYLGRKSGRGFYDYSEETPAPATLPPGPMPSEIVAPEFMAHEEPLLARLERNGVAVRRADIAHIEVGDVKIFPTDGRPAALLIHAGMERNLVVMDAALEWESADRIAIAVDSRADDGTAATAAGALQAADLEVSLVDDAPGLVVARIAAQLVSVAADAALVGVAAPDDIDTAMRLGTNYPGGPFEWADAGRAVRWMNVLDNLRWFYGEERYRASPLLRRAVHEGMSLRERGTR